MKPESRSQSVGIRGGAYDRSLGTLLYSYSIPLFVLHRIALIEVVAEKSHDVKLGTPDCFLRGTAFQLGGGKTCFLSH